MLSDEERFQNIDLAGNAILMACKNHGVVLTVNDGEIFIHHGEWHESGDYSVREVTLSSECTL